MTVILVEGVDEPPAAPAPTPAPAPQATPAPSPTPVTTESVTAPAAASTPATPAPIYQQVTFAQKAIECDFTMQSAGSLTTSGLRTEAHIVKAGGLSMGSASVAIYGMTLSQMNQLSTYGIIFTNTYKNSITIKAGDLGGQLSTVFQGTIQTAYMDGQSQPQVCFRIEAFAGAIESVTPAQATTIDGSGDAAQMIGKLAQQMGLTFENNGVNAKLNNPYYGGSLRTQVKEIAEHAGIEWVIESGKLAIWPAGQARSGGAIVISPQTGMRGYPAFNQSGVIVKSIFNPNLKYGGSIQVQSQITPACGTWNINTLEYDLACFVKNGPWFNTIGAVRPGQMVVS